jgi:hypothetical protein
VHEHIPAVLAAAQHVQQTVKYIPITTKDKQTAEQAGIFAGAVAGLLLLLGLARGRRQPATSSR